MSTPIQITPEYLHNVASEFRKASSDLADMLQQLDRTANSLMSSWQGKSRTSFDQLWSIWYRALRDLCALLDSMAGTMETGATNMTTVDQTSIPHATP